MQSMLEGYMDFAKSDVEEETGEVDLVSLLEDFEKQGKLRKNDIRTSMVGRRDIVVRPVAFKRLLENVISNSFRYATRTEIVARNTKGWLTMTVDDNGPGIPPDMREEVFKPFYRLDEARNLDESGTGLGLAIARDIARRHGGAIALDDSTLGGLQVSIRIPV